MLAKRFVSAKIKRALWFKFRKKSHTAEKKLKGGPFCLSSAFASKDFGLVQISNPRSPPS